MKKWLQFVIYFLGCILPLLANLFNFSLLTSNLLFILFISLETIIFYSLCQKYGFKKIALGLMIICLIFGFLNFKDIKIGFMRTYNQIVTTYSYSINMSFSTFSLYEVSKEVLDKGVMKTLMLFNSFSIIILYYFYCIKNSHLFTFLWTFLVSSTTLIIQILLNWLVMIPLFAYWGVLVLPSFKTFALDKTRCKQMILVVLTIVLSSNLLLSKMTQTEFKEIYYPERIQTDIIEKINEIIQRFSDIQYQDSKVDLKFAGNRYYKDIVHAKVEREERESLYLKTFSGAIYKDNQWKSLSSQIYENYEFDYTVHDDYGIFDHFESSMKWINSYSINNHTIEKISIEDIRKGNHFSMLPYYLRLVSEPYNLEFDYAYKLENLQKKTEFEIWKVQNINNYIEKRTQYDEFIFNRYQQLPLYFSTMIVRDLGLDTAMELRQSFYDSYGIEGSYTDDYLAFNEDYIQFVSDYVKSFLRNYTYTLTPGYTPSDADFVEYFLKKNKKGYCVHFASSAALLFRYYGIPTRYVEGYQLNANQFDVNMQANVLDSDAHAWIEVFTLDKGWTPIEVTVGGMEVKPDNPENNNISKPPTNPTKPDNPSNNTPLNPKPDNPDTPPNENIVYSFDWLIWLGCFISLFIIYFLIRKFILHKRSKKFRQENRKQAIFEMVKYLQRIDKKYPIINDELNQIFEKNKFSKEEISEEEYMFVLAQTHLLPRACFNSLSKFNKFVFKYIRCFI